MMGRLACEEKARLTEEFDRATRVFSSAVTEMTRLMGNTPVDRYAEITVEADAARTECENARLALVNHSAEHGC